MTKILPQITASVSNSKADLVVLPPATPWLFSKVVFLALKRVAEGLASSTARQVSVRAMWLCHAGSLFGIAFDHGVPKF